MRVVAYLSIAATLLTASVSGAADKRLIYVVIAAGLVLVVAAQDLVPRHILAGWRRVVETTAFIVFISILVMLSGDPVSPMAIGYVFIICGAVWWGGAVAPLLLGAASALGYVAASLALTALTGATFDATALVRAETGAGLLLGAGSIAAVVGWFRRRSRLPRSQARVMQAGALSDAVTISRPAAWQENEQAAGTTPRPARAATTVRRAPQLTATARPVPPLLRDAPADALDRSIRGLLQQAPEMSAFHTLSRVQMLFLLVVLAVVGAGVVIAPLNTVIALNAAITVIYLLAMFFNIAIFRALLRKPPMVMVTDAEALAVVDDELPSYTVLLAAYRESEIIAATIRQLERLDYPRDRLDILLLLEADDGETIAAARAARPAEHIRVVVIPDGLPKTKPKACNYGLQISSGELVTIYDAEDRPDPLQLRRAAVALSRLPPEVACLQARLEFHNERQNILTRWFSAEYVTWFSAVLPALVRLNVPVPLGGTSMHVRRAVLEAVGAWDPFNVTEDADLGIRLQRFGYRTLVLDSVTLEEANSDFINWIKQRSRWYKGYLQTWLVHMRQPRRVWRELGPAGVLGLAIVVGSTPLLALLNPLFWTLTALWFLTEANVVRLLFPAVVFYPALISVVFGNFLALYRTMVAVRLGNHPALVAWVLLVPFYWVFMSMAALRAFVQLLVAPSFWEKTLHGLDQMRESPPSQSAGRAAGDEHHVEVQA